MKYGLIPQTPLEGAALALGLVPTPLADTLVAIWLARSVMVATKLGVFEALAASPLSASALAARCRTDPRGTAKLLDALVPTGYLQQKNGRYALSAMARRWMPSAAPRSLYDATLWRFVDWEFAEHFERFVRSGEPLRFHEDMTPERWQLYQRGMRSHAQLAAGEVARRTPVPRGARAMLDVGGGHGLFSVALCRRHPRLGATVFDLPAAVDEAAPLLAAEGMGDRIVHQAGDALTEDFGEAVYDLVFVANLVHHFDGPTNCALVGRLARALRPGGCLVVHEVIRPGSSKEAGGAGALADLYFAATSQAGTWSFGEIADWQRAAGLHPRRPVRLLTVPGLGQQAAFKPAG